MLRTISLFSVMEIISLNLNDFEVCYCLMPLGILLLGDKLLQFCHHTVPACAVPNPNVYVNFGLTVFGQYSLWVLVIENS